MNTDKTDQSDRDIAQGLLQRDEAAVKQLTQRYASTLTRIACLYLGDVHAAEDVAQETLIALWDGAPKTRNSIRLKPWMFGILFNRCRKLRRSLSRRLRRERVAADMRTAEPANEERLKTLHEALLKLKGDLRSIIILRFEQGFSVAQTAETLGLPEGTVKSRTRAAIRALKAHVRCEP